VPGAAGGWTGAGGRGFAVRRDAGCGLIILGLQNDLVHPDGFFGRKGLGRVAEAELGRVIENVNALAARLRETGRPVVHGCWQLRPDHLDAGYSAQWRRLGLREAGALVRGSWGAALHPQLVVAEDDFLLPLTSHSAFQFTALDRTLRNCGVRACILAGGPVNEGIDDTARQGAALGYLMFLGSDAIYPPDSPHLASLSTRGDVLATAALLAELRLDQPFRPEAPLAAGGR
jgi:gluconolactonase